MSHHMLSNGFAKKNMAQIKVNKAQPYFSANKTLQVYILSANDHVSSLLLTHLSGLKDVHLCRVFNNVKSMLHTGFAGNAILFADADLIDKENIASIKNAMPQILIIAVADNNESLPAQLHESVFNYLCMPIVFGDVFSVVRQALLFFKTFDNAVQTKRNIVLIKSEYRLLKINLSDILFVVGMKDYIKIWLKDKSKPITTLQNLKEFESKLMPQDFIRVHKSYIVALQHIDCIARNEITIGTYSIPVGDAFRNGLNDFIATHS